MNEPQLIEDLRVALDDATVHVGARPDAAERARAQGRRRRATRGLLAGVPVLALAGGLIIALHSGAAGPATSKPAVETAAYVTAHIEAALGKADNYMIRTATHGYSGGVYTEWTDPRTGSSYAEQGTGSHKILSWNSTFFVAKVLHWSTTEADYSSHTWFVSIIHAAGPIQGPAPTGPDVPGGSPAQIKKWLEDGTYKIVGHGYVDGHHATELRADLGPFVSRLWVDSQTYQPVRVVKAFTGGLKGHVLSFDEVWQPRAAALVKIANHPQIPAGFNRIAAPK
jgi:hypothetical protein